MRNEFQKHYGSLFEEWKIDLAISRLDEMGFPRSDWPDLMQELAIALLKFRYDPNNSTKATEKTVIFSFITLELLNLRRKQSRRCLRHKKYADINGPCDEAMDYSHHPTNILYHEDIFPIVATLSEFDRNVCDGLALGLTKNKIAKRLGCSWATVNKAVGRIREHFRLNGINGWVE